MRFAQFAFMLVSGCNLSSAKALYPARILVAALATVWRVGYNPAQPRQPGDPNAAREDGRGGYRFLYDVCATDGTHGDGERITP